MRVNPNALIGGSIYGLLRHIYKLLQSKEYRKYALYCSQYGEYKRFIETSIKLEKNIIQVADVASFLSQYEEIYLNKIYDLPIQPSKILDLGANIGMGVMWFKKTFPDAEIVAVEADAKIYKLLEHNTSKLNQVELLNVAVWDQEEELCFQSDGSDGGRLDTTESNASATTVKAIDIRNILEDYGPFDFIKMDVEGAESRVLPACKGCLQGTKFIFCEYHSTEGEEQWLPEILRLLKDEGFRTHVQPINVSGQPFLMRNINAGFDMQMNIFAWKV